MKNSTYTYFSLIFLTLIWGGTFSAIKHLLRIFSPSELLMARFLPASIIFALIATLFYYKESKRIIKEQLLRVCLIGLLGIPAYHFSLNYGETEISAGLASLIIGLNPTLTFIFSLFLLKGKPKKLKLVGIAVSFLGLYILVRYGSGQELTFKYLAAFFITILAPASWALYTIVSKPLTQNYSLPVLASVTTVIGSVPTVLFLSKDFLVKFSSLEIEYFLSLTFLSIVSTVIGTFIWLAAVKKISPVRVSSFIYFVPLFAVLLGVAFLGESLNAMLIIGGLLIMGGVWVTNRKFS